MSQVVCGDVVYCRGKASVVRIAGTVEKVVTVGLPGSEVYQVRGSDGVLYTVRGAYFEVSREPFPSRVRV